METDSAWQLGKLDKAKLKTRTRVIRSGAMTGTGATIPNDLPLLITKISYT